MQKTLTATAALIALATPGFAKPKTADPVFVASGKWVVNDNGDFCTLSRAFATATASLLFTYQPGLTFSGAKIVLASDDAKLLRRNAASITLLPSGRTFAVDAAVPSFEKGSALVISSNDHTFAAEFAGSSALRLGFAGGRAIDLVLGSAKAAGVALRTCEDDRLRRYGLDPAAVVTIPIERVVAAFSRNDYPPEARRAGAQGRAVTILSFDRAGEPLSCKVATSSGSDALDRASCAVLLRGLRIDPAPDGPETRWTIHPVRWVLPGGRR